MGQALLARRHALMGERDADEAFCEALNHVDALSPFERAPSSCTANGFAASDGVWRTDPTFARR